MKYFHNVIFTLAMVGSLATPSAAHPTANQRLASEFARAAVSRIAYDPLTVDALQMGVGLIIEATNLDPNNVDFWQTALNIAQMAENDQLKSKAVERLNALDPGHEVARLMRFNAALDKFQVFEERKAAYERLLTDANVPRIGETVASRLALDLALLHQRRGEMDDFSRWLTLALTWDRSNRSAAAIATGFYRSQVNDPEAVAELLVNLVLADPTDVSAQVDLAQLLLEHGAFNAAQRIYRLASNGLKKDQKVASTGMVVDHAVSLWALGRDNEAVEILSRRQNDLNNFYRVQLKQQKPELTYEELMSMRLLDQGLTTVAAVILANRSDRDAVSSAQTAVLACVASVDSLKEQAASTSDPQALDRINAELANRYLESAWVALWLNVQVDQVSGWVDAAAAIQPMSADATNRFAGWLAYRKGEFESAAAILKPMAESDLVARLGLAHALLAQGKSAEAAREFLTINQAQPGSVIGIWSAARVKEIVGRPVSPPPAAAELERLITSIPAQFDRTVDDPTLAISLHLTMSKQTYDAYEPITATLQLTNTSPYPLALDRNGPIRPQVLIMPSVRSAQADRSGQLRAFIVDISRTLRLLPRESLTVNLDLRNYWPGEAINSLAVNGALLKLRTFLNFAVTGDGAAVPGLYGTEIEAPLVRVDGQRITQEWVQETVAIMNAFTTGDELLRRMAMFTHFIAPPVHAEATLDERQMLDAARIAFAEAFAKLDGPSQAWLLCVMPRGSQMTAEGLQSTLAIARQSQDRLVTIAYLALHATGPKDPMFDAARRSDDTSLRTLIDAMQADLQLRENATQR